jgi:hypothetical protein
MATSTLARASSIHSYSASYTICFEVSRSSLQADLIRYQINFSTNSGEIIILQSVYNNKYSEAGNSDVASMQLQLLPSNSSLKKNLIKI